MIQLLLAVIYLSFISLGLPDALLGSAWPSMYGEFGVPVSCAGAISMIIAFGTIISSLLSDRFTRKHGTGKVTAISVGLTALALFGFSVSHSFRVLLIWAVPYGLGAGSVDAALNNYVALHYSSRHMSWLHCMWGIGASVGPYIMGYALTGGKRWNMGYRYIAILQIFLTVILLVSLPLWKKRPRISSGDSGQLSSGEGVRLSSEAGVRQSEKALTLKQVIRIPGAKEIMMAFFCYCALEQTAGLWGSSFLVLHHGVTPEEAARFAGLFFLGITVGRAVSGFLTLALNDAKLVRLGETIILVGVCSFVFFNNRELAKIGLVLIGLGCAPIYPCIIHSTPERFGADKSQAIIGIQMASAYVGTCIMPPVFGLIAEHIDIGWFPAYLFAILAVMVFMHERMIAKSRG